MSFLWLVIPSSPTADTPTLSPTPDTRPEGGDNWYSSLHKVKEPEIKEIASSLKGLKQLLQHYRFGLMAEQKKFESLSG